MRFWRQDIEENDEGEILDNSEVADYLADYLSDILDTLRPIEASLIELVNQGDKQVEFLSRLVTLFEGLAREPRNGPA